MYFLSLNVLYNLESGRCRWWKWNFTNGVFFSVHLMMVLHNDRVAGCFKLNLLRTTAPSIGVKVQKGIFLVCVAIYWESNLHIFYQSQISQHSNLIFMPLEYFRHLDMCWSGFKDREHILSTCQLLIYAINCRLARWWWWSWWIIAIVIMMIILWLWLRMKKLWSYGHDYNHLSADNLCHQMQLVVRIMI